MTLKDLSDDDLLSRLHGFCSDSRRADVNIILHLIEVEERRLDLKSACSSLFDFCLHRMRMSPGIAFRRINAARMAKRCPEILGPLERGEIHLCTLLELRDHLNPENVGELLAAVSGKSKREVQEILARRAPRPDVPGVLAKLQANLALASSVGEPLVDAPAAAPAPRPRIEPLSAERYMLQLTASKELHDKLERARDLMRHRNPSGDLAVVVERALDALLAELEKERLGKTQRVAATRRSVAAGRVPRAARREVFERDGEQCTFVDGDRRCPARGFLEVDHRESRGLGGSGEAENLRVLCRAHNQLHAEEVFGRAHVERQRDLRRRKSRGAARPAAAAAAQEPDSVFDQVTRGLVNLGFRSADAMRAVREVRERDPASNKPVNDVLREAIGALT